MIYLNHHAANINIRPHDVSIVHHVQLPYLCLANVVVASCNEEESAKCLSPSDVSAHLPYLLTAKCHHQPP